MNAADTTAERADPTRLLTPGTRCLMRVTDWGFLTYWTLVALHLVPPRVLFADYHLASVAAWNWSFLPLDLTASITGLIAIRQPPERSMSAERLAAISLLITSVAGGMAIAYWAMRGQFNVLWWLPNLFLLCWPLPSVAKMGARPRRVISGPPSQTEWRQRPGGGCRTRVARHAGVVFVNVGSVRTDGLSTAVQRGVHGGVHVYSYPLSAG